MSQGQPMPHGDYLLRVQRCTPIPRGSGLLGPVPGSVPTPICRRHLGDYSRLDHEVVQQPRLSVEAFLP